MITKYTELIWASKVANEYSLDGYHHAPKPSCSRLPIPRNTTRREEVLLMSLFYPNNLFNSNLYRNTYQIESPLCQRCRRQEETPYHIILECSNLAGEARRVLETEISEEETYLQDSTTLLNGSRNSDFLKICLEILSQHKYRDQVDLTID